MNCIGFKEIYYICSAIQSMLNCTEAAVGMCDAGALTTAMSMIQTTVINQGCTGLIFQGHAFGPDGDGIYYFIQIIL